MSSDRQTYINDMQKIVTFVDVLKSTYKELKEIIIFGKDAIETKYKDEVNGWKVPIFFVTLVLNNNKKEYLYAKDLWMLFKYTPQLKFPKNTAKRKIDKNCYIKVSIGTYKSTYNGNAYYNSIGGVVNEDTSKLEKLYKKYEKTVELENLVKRYPYYDGITERSLDELLDGVDISDDDLPSDSDDE